MHKPRKAWGERGGEREGGGRTAAARQNLDGARALGRGRRGWPEGANFGVRWDHFFVFHLADVPEAFPGLLQASPALLELLLTTVFALRHPLRSIPGPLLRA